MNADTRTSEGDRSDTEVPIGGVESRRRRRLAIITGFIIGVALLGAAGWAVFSRPEMRRQLAASLADGPWWLVALLCVLPAVNWVLTSATFWALTGRFGRVGFVEMSWAIGAAWVFNYLPMRPGMLGRFAYHKIVNQVRIRDSARVVIEAMLASIVGGAVVLGIALVLPVEAPTWVWSAVLLVPMLLAGIIAGATWQCGAWSRVALAGSLRYCEILVWLVRYVAAFSLIDAPIDLRTAAIVTAVSQLALAIPISGNGLGIREWGVGLTTGALFAAGVIEAPDASAATALGLAADLLVRGAELLPAIVIGLLASVMIVRHTHRATATRAEG